METVWIYNNIVFLRVLFFFKAFSETVSDITPVVVQATIRLGLFCIYVTSYFTSFHPYLTQTKKKRKYMFDTNVVLPFPFIITL